MTELGAPEGENRPVSTAPALAGPEDTAKQQAGVFHPGLALPGAGLQDVVGWGGEAAPGGHNWG